VPTAQVTRFGPGEQAQSVAAGDILLTHRGGMIPRLIRLGQRRRFRRRRRPYAHWSHAALVTDSSGRLVEAESRGVESSPITKYRQREYHIVHTGQLLDDGGNAAVAYADAQVGKPFGFLVLASLGVWLATGIRVRWRRGDHQICSGLVARALRESGHHFERDPTFMLPADLAEAFHVTPRVP
jgi:uncharacterized protein YycO